VLRGKKVRAVAASFAAGQEAARELHGLQGWRAGVPRGRWLAKLEDRAEGGGDGLRKRKV
jgi:hypothetical protein